MADYFTLTSFAIPVPPGREAAELQKWCGFHVEESERLTYEDGSDEAMEIYDERYQGLEFEFRPGGENTPAYVWVHEDESASIAAAIWLVQDYLKHFEIRHEGLWFSWADICSKPRLDSFLGGGAFVTHDDHHIVSSYDAIKIGEKAGVSLLSTGLS